MNVPQSLNELFNMVVGVACGKRDAYKDGILTEAEYVKAQKELIESAIISIQALINQAVVGELEHWLALVAWPNNYQSMQAEMKKRIEELRNGETDG